MNGRALTIVSLAALMVIAGACKTQEQIRREQMVDSMAHQVGQGQRVSAEIVSRVQNLEARSASITGQLEEIRHESTTVVKEENAKLKGQIEALETSNKARDKEIEDLKTALQEQRQYIEKVVASLGQLASESNKKPSKSEGPAEGKSASGKKQSELDNALADYEANNFSDARTSLLKLLDNKKLKGGDRAKILHNLGMIEYLEKNYDGALVYFSRLFTEHPGSSLNSSGLLHLGLAFKNLKKNEEAKQTLNELLGRYPKSKHATTAKGVLKKL